MTADCVFTAWVVVALVVIAAVGAATVFAAGACFGYNVRKMEEGSKEGEG